MAHRVGVHAPGKHAADACRGMAHGAACAPRRRRLDLGEGGGAPRRRDAYDPGMRREACTKPDEAPASASWEDACTREGMRAELRGGWRELSNSAHDIRPPVNMT